MGQHRFSLALSIILVFACACRAASYASGPAPSEVSGRANVTDSPESVVIELYAALSFASGKGIDRNRVRLLFTPDARILFAGRRPDGTPGERTFSVESFLDFATPVGETASREEKELWRRVERFGNIAHVFSAYELRFVTDAASKPTIRRGINSVQLSYDGSKWRIVSLIWDVERPGNPLPSRVRNERP